MKKRDSRRPDPTIATQAEAALRSARHVGLRHVTDAGPGLTRRRAGRARAGKRWIERFRIEDAKGHVVNDVAVLERIRKLAIPPAWDRVWICPEPQGHIQATGRDARGRKQYRYHARWREERDSTKYARLVEFGSALPTLRRQVTIDLRLPGLPMRKVLATIVRLLETTFIRVGNEEYVRENGSFGLTTLQNRHVDIHASEIFFHFRGKSGIYHKVSVHDPRIARTVRQCRDLPGQELFQYLDEAGDHVPIDSADVNSYIHEIAGNAFTAKDFRTWAGTLLAAMSLSRSSPVAERPALSQRDQTQRLRRRTSKADHRDVVRAIEQVAQRLGNTPSVCRKCYIHPHVITAYHDGTLATIFGKHRKGHQQQSTALRGPEAAVLALLRKLDREESHGNGLTRRLRASLRLPQARGIAAAAA